tara:strand:+ start:4935 stop:5753 length:819 start_codon:yes stop_codon:yes gene_type:complete
MSTFGYQIAGFGGGEGFPSAIDVDAISFNRSSSSKITYANGIFKNALSRIEPSTNHPSSMSISFWIKPETLSGNSSYPIFYHDNGGSDPTIKLYYKYFSSGMYLEIFFVGSTDTVSYSTGIGSITGGAWNHVVFSWYEGNMTPLINGATLSFGSSGSTCNNIPDDDDDTVFGYDGSSYGTFDLAEFIVNQNAYHPHMPNTTANKDLRYLISQTSRPNTPTVQPTDGKPVVQDVNDNLVYLSGSHTTWSQKGTTDLGTQTLSNITTAGTKPSL